MIDPALLTIAAWRTVNKRRQHRAEQLCKNYALSKFQPALYAGRLSTKERKEFKEKIEKLFSGKRDLLHLFSSCRSCAVNASDFTTIEKQYQPVGFEII